MSLFYVTVRFDDGSQSDYYMQNLSDRPWGQQFIERCKVSLLERLEKYGKYGGALGRGRHPDPKPVEITKEWVQ